MRAYYGKGGEASRDLFLSLSHLETIVREEYNVKPSPKPAAQYAPPAEEAAPPAETPAPQQYGGRVVTKEAPN